MTENPENAGLLNGNGAVSYILRFFISFVLGLIIGILILAAFWYLEIKIGLFYT